MKRKITAALLSLCLMLAVIFCGCEVNVTSSGISIKTSSSENQSSAAKSSSSSKSSSKASSKASSAR